MKSYIATMIEVSVVGLVLVLAVVVDNAFLIVDVSYRDPVYSSILGFTLLFFGGRHVNSSNSYSM